MGFLRQLSTGGVKTQLLPPYSLTTRRAIAMGREPSCQISLDPHLYTGVSRRHAIINPRDLGNAAVWEISDLGSSNGTYVNGKRLQKPEILQSGDHITLGENGPEFIIEYDKETVFAPSPDSLTVTQLFPIVSKGKDLTRKGFLIPGIFTVIFVVLMFASVGNAQSFQILLAMYLAGAAYYYVYQICGKRKPWWVLFSSGLATIAILISPLLPLFIFVFRDILPGSILTRGDNLGLMELFIGMFFGAGLMEELLKALPILGAYWLGKKFNSPWRERIGVWEPLDGILLGTASAVGFTLLETLSQYVPNIIDQAGELAGIQLLIPRIIGSVAGHMAYSGYLGYFIGLSILKPRQGWQILIVGYLTASLLHALWNTVGYYSILLLATVGVISYAFLAAAILKARALSPTREQNFATNFSRKY